MYCGNLKFGSVVLIDELFATEAPALPAAAAHAVGGVAMLAALNVGTASDVAPVVEPLQVSDAKPVIPELPYAFERYTNGGGPVNSPTPPRSWLAWSPVTSQLNATRGETTPLPGTLCVSR